MERTTDELEQEVRQLKGEVDEMRARMARLETNTPGHQNGVPRSDRRGFLRLGAAAVMGALGWAAVRAVPAAAATGGNFILGNANLAEAPTTLTGDSGTPSPVLGVKSQNFNAPALATAIGAVPLAGAVQALGADGAPGFEGIDAWASGSLAYGVYGLTDAGVGVVGESNTGIGVYARRSGRFRQEGLALANIPGYTPNNYEQVRDLNGILWIHNSTGVWRRVNTVRTDNADGSGTAFKPIRVLDTRGPAFNQPRKAAGSVTSIVVAGVGTGASHIPADAIAVMGNLTAADYTGGGFLTIMPNGITIGTGAGQYNPSTDPASVNFQVGQGAIGNAFVCGLTAGSLEVYVGGPPLPGHDSHFILDVTAYIQ
jgi:hypothetical protein